LAEVECRQEIKATPLQCQGSTIPFIKKSIMHAIPCFKTTTLITMLQDVLDAAHASREGPRNRFGFE